MSERPNVQLVRAVLSIYAHIIAASEQTGRENRLNHSMRSLTQQPLRACLVGTACRFVGGANGASRSFARSTLLLRCNIVSLSLDGSGSS